VVFLGSLRVARFGEVVDGALVEWRIGLLLLVELDEYFEDGL